MSSRNPKGAEQNYVPKIPEVKSSPTRLVDPEGRESIRIYSTDKKPGDIPICLYCSGSLEDLLNESLIRRIKMALLIKFAVATWLWTSLSKGTISLFPK